MTRRRRYPYCRNMYARRWCRVCLAIRGVRLKRSRDMHVCLTCGAITSGVQEFARNLYWEGYKVIASHTQRKADTEWTIQRGPTAPNVAP